MTKLLQIQKNITKKFRRASEGFTLAETLVAILILTVSVSAMLNLAGGAFFSVRYSRNDIVGNNLVQEAVEYIRNSRDSAYLSGGTSNTWSQTLNTSGCFSADGCVVDPYNQGSQLGQHFIPCPSTGCPAMYFFDGGSSRSSFYGYNGSDYTFSSGTSYPTTYIRTVKLTNSGGQIIVNVSLRWKNGTADKSVSQIITLTDWNI